MRAVVVREPGGPDQLSLEEVADPRAGPGELLVEVQWASLNFIDTYHRGGLYPMDLPFVPGMEGSGSVVAVGEGVDGYSLGDRVGWADVLGTYAELVVVPAERAIALPDGVPGDVAAAVLLQGMTAHYLAMDTYPLSEGDRCLIHAGAGGVGLLLTQIAKMRGAYVVTTVGSEQKAALCRAAGADEVIVYTETDFRTAIESSLGPKSLDVVYDGVGAATFHDSLAVLRPRGMMVTFGNASGPVPEVSPLQLMREGSLYLTRPTMGHYLRTPEERATRVTDLFTWIEDGRLDVRVGERFPLERAADAHRSLEGRKTTGKVLLHP